MVALALRVIVALVARLGWLTRIDPPSVARQAASKGRSWRSSWGVVRAANKLRRRRTAPARRLRPAFEEAGLQVPDDDVEWMPTHGERSTPGRGECEEQRQAQPDHTRNAQNEQ